MKKQFRPNYFPGFKKQLEENNNISKIKKWKQEDVEHLLEMVQTLQEKSKDQKINWQYIGKQLGRNANSCYNKYIMLKEPEFTEYQEAKLVQWWRQNKDTEYDLNELVELLKPHSRRAVLLRLQASTRGNNKFQFDIPPEEYKNFEV